nr:MAG TPA: hypothetical protein [Caudoviricetes sp.]
MYKKVIGPKRKTSLRALDKTFYNIVISIWL